MKMILSHKIELKPNSRQITYFKKACGTARFAYNWGLAEWKSQYKSGNKPTTFKMKKLWNSIKKVEFPWVYDVTKCASEQAILDLGRAFNNFWNKRSNYPKFKKKNTSSSFYLSNDQFILRGKTVKIPKLGFVRLHESLRFSGKIISGTVSSTANKWFISVNVETEDILKPNENQIWSTGVDLGVSTLATFSNGEIISNPRTLYKFSKKLRRCQRTLSRKCKGSINRNKFRLKLAKLHYRIANIRLDNLHKLTNHLAVNFTNIGIEDLNVKGMLRNHNLARSISDCSFSEFRRQLEYKCSMTKANLVIFDRWYPSSKRCSRCGNIKKKLNLSNRIYKCEVCGLYLDRDLNAAINLDPSTVGSTGIDACGVESAGFVAIDKAKLSTKKQEKNTKVVNFR